MHTWKKCSNLCTQIQHFKLNKNINWSKRWKYLLFFCVLLFINTYIYICIRMHVLRMQNECKYFVITFWSQILQYFKLKVVNEVVKLQRSFRFILALSVKKYSLYRHAYYHQSQSWRSKVWILLSQDTHLKLYLNINKMKVWIKKRRKSRHVNQSNKSALFEEFYLHNLNLSSSFVNKEEKLCYHLTFTKKSLVLLVFINFIEETQCVSIKISLYSHLLAIMALDNNDTII